MGATEIRRSILLILKDKITPSGLIADWTDTILLTKPGPCKPLFCAAFLTTGLNQAFDVGVQSQIQALKACHLIA